MKKIHKILCFVFIFVFTFVISIVPCFAAPSGNGILSGGVQDFYVDIINLPGFYSWANNDWALSTTSIAGDEFFSSVADNTIVDGRVTGGSLYANTGIASYDGKVEVASDTVCFEVTNDIFNIPYFDVSFDGFEVLGNAVVRVVGEVADYDGSNKRSFDFSYTPSTFDGWYTTHEILFHLPVECDVGDIIQFKCMIGFDVTKSNISTDWSTIKTRWAVPDLNYFRDPLVTVHRENIDVLSWLPETIDSFFNVSVIGNVTIGNIFLLVLAVPALIAVFRMLGGVG